MFIKQTLPWTCRGRWGLFAPTGSRQDLLLWPQPRKFNHQIVTRFQPSRHFGRGSLQSKIDVAEM
jgi:hypothetical protein